MSGEQPRRMSRADRRAALLDAAAEVLRSPERVPLTFESLATAAGVSATLPYKYFDSVDQLVDELYHRLVGAIDDQTDKLLADPDRTLDDKVRDTITLWTDAVRRDGMLLLRLTDDVAHASLRPLIDRRRERAVDVWAEQIEADVGLDTTTARVVAGSITAGSNAVLRRWIIDRLDRRAVIELFVAMCRGQIEAAAAASRA